MSLIPDAEIDFDLENNEEFAEFIRKHNLSAETLAFAQKEIQAEVKYGMSMIQKAAAMAAKKIKADSSKIEASALDKSEKPNRVKRSLRNSSMKVGSAPQTVSRRQSDRKRNLQKNDVNNLLSQELEEKATLSALTDKPLDATAHILDGNIPEGMVRILVLSPVGIESPHFGALFEVEPKSKGASKKCKIGRSEGEEYVKFGISLPKDLEISQKHGVLTRTKNKNAIDFFFIDVGSSNGTFDDAKGVRLETNIPYQLENGMQLRLGQSVLQFNFSTNQSMLD